MGKKRIKVTGATLAGLEIFSGLGSGERDEIARLCRVQEYQPDELVISHRDNAAEVFFIISGSVRVTIYSGSGKEITFRDVKAGQMFGELSAIDGSPRSAHVIALEATTLATVSANNFWLILEQYPEVNKKTLQYLTRLVRSLSDRVVEFSTLGVKKRIHAELLRLCRIAAASGDTLTIRPAPTHSEIASRVKTTREAVTRELSSLARQGYIRKEGQALIVMDLKGFERMVNDKQKGHE